MPMLMPMPAEARKILKNREADAEADAGWYKKIYADADADSSKKNVKFLNFFTNPTINKKIWKY